MPLIKINGPVQRLKIAVLPLDLPCFGPLTHSGEIITTGKSRGKKPENNRVHLDRLQNKYTNCKGIKNNTDLGQITRIYVRETGYNV